MSFTAFVFYHLIIFIRPHAPKFAAQKSFLLMNWILLIIAGLFEVAFASCLGKARTATGTEMYLWYLGFLVSLTISMVLLIKATQTLPIGTAYVVWTGIGALGSALMGIFVFKDPITFWRVFFLVTLIGSVVGLKVVSPEH